MPSRTKYTFLALVACLLMVAGVFVWLHGKGDSPRPSSDAPAREKERQADYIAGAEQDEASQMLKTYGQQAQAYAQKVNDCPQASCQVKITRGLRDSIQQLRSFYERIQATQTYSRKCESELQDLESKLLEAELAWTLVLTRWEHVTRVPVMPGLAEENLDDAIQLSNRLSEQHFPQAISTCYPASKRQAMLDAIPHPHFPVIDESWWPKENAHVPLSTELSPAEIAYAQSFQ